VRIDERTAMTGRRALILRSVAILLGVVLLGTAWRWWRPVETQEAAPTASEKLLDSLQQTYGPNLYSQHDEETLIRAFFEDRKAGFFLDVGASHYEKDSTTYYLEKHLGWRGIAIDALEEFRPEYERFRPGTRFFAFFVTNQAGLPKDFHVYTRDTRISSGSREQLQGLPRVKDRFIKTIQVPSITLDHLLGAERVEKVDFVSMDIEGSEPAALEGFDIERYRPDLLCVEVQTYTRERLLAYFASHHYVPIESYRAVDEVNIYFRRSS
jgi:FkbM family methyltransferase